MSNSFPSSPVDNLGALAGRLLLGAIFLWFGIAKATAPAATIAGFTKLGLPLPEFAYGLTVFIELGIGLLFVLGFYTKPSACILAFWCIATAVAGHSDFADRNMLTHFLKNVSMCGGFIYAALAGPGAYSLDALRLRRSPRTYSA
jgi:putative oxidoreductase